MKNLNISILILFVFCGSAAYSQTYVDGKLVSSSSVTTIFSTGTLPQSTNFGSDTHVTTSGATRGTQAVDLQADRALDAQVASGPWSALGGGSENKASGYFSAIAGGETNTASGYYSTVPGGNDNVASGDFSFAAGRRAKATVAGAFALADDTNSDFTNSTASSFAARFNGGYSLTGGFVGIGFASGADTLLHISHATTPTLRLERNDVTITTGEEYGSIEWEGQDASTDASGVRGRIVVVGEGDFGATNMVFYSATSGAGGIIESFRIDENQNMSISGDLDVSGNITGSFPGIGLDIAGDSGTAAVNLDSQTFSIIGTAQEIDTVATGQRIIVGLPAQVLITTSLAFSAGAEVGEFSIDGTLAGNSDAVVSTEKAVKTYVDTLVTEQDIDFVGGSGTGSVDIDSQLFAILGTEFEISTVANGTTLTIGLPDSPAITNNLSIGHVSPNRKLHIQSVTDTAIIRLERNDTTIITNDSYGSLEWEGQDADAGGDGIRGRIDLIGSGDDRGATDMVFSTAPDDAAVNEQMRLTSEGNLGINETNPDSRLEVNGTFHATGAVTLDSTLGLQSGTTVNELSIDDTLSGDSDDALPTEQAVKGYVDTLVTEQDLDTAGDSGTGAVDLDSQSLTVAGTSNEIVTVASGQTITVGLPNTVSITTDLSIGHISPDVKLHIQSLTDTSIIRLERNDTSIVAGDSYGALEWEGQDDGSGANGIRGKIDLVGSGTDEGAADMVFSIAADGSAIAEGMRLTSVGRLGLNETNPAYLFEANTDVISYVISIGNDGNNANRSGLRIQSGEDSPSGTNIVLGSFDGDGDLEGGLENAAGTFQLFDISDRRLKDDITTSTKDGLAMVQSFRVVDYNRTGRTKRHTGFTAQQLELVYPDAVSTKTYTKQTTEEDSAEDGYSTYSLIVRNDDGTTETQVIHELTKSVMTIRPMMLIPILVKGMQQQQKQIKRLKADRETDRARLKALEDMVNDLHSVARAEKITLSLDSANDGFMRLGWLTSESYTTADLRINSLHP